MVVALARQPLRPAGDAVTGGAQGPRARVGTSGWTYPYWPGDFYPQGLRQRDELAYNVRHFDAVELNGSFYSLQRPSSYERWRQEATAERPDVRFAIKGSRYVTHLKRLRDVRVALANFFASGVLAMAEQTGPFLWQLPPALEYDADLLAAFFDLLPRTSAEAAELAAGHDDKVKPDRVLTKAAADVPYAHALEPRHRSFESDEALALLREHGISSVIADTGGRFARWDEPTAEVVYVRLHGPEGLYDSSYTGEQLDGWAERLRGWRADGHEAYVFFDNDGHCRAPYDAQGLIARL